MMMSCGAEPTTIPPKRPAPSLPKPADAEILAIAIEYVFDKVEIPESLKSGEKILIVQRQTFILEKCAKIGLYKITPNEKGYLEFHGATDPPPPSHQCIASQALYETIGEDHSQMDDCINRNKYMALLPSLESKRAFRFEDRLKIRSAFNKGFWKEFYRVFPEAGGLLELSLPGYSNDRKEACVYLEFSCDGLWGRGMAIFLDYQQGQWRITKRSMAWIS